MNKLICAILAAALIGIISSPFAIRVLKVLKFGQNVRSEGPSSHLNKAGTPTMGGIIIIISLTLTILFINKSIDGVYTAAMISTLGNGLIGLLDDSLKIINKRSLGLKAYQKLSGQFLFALVLAFYSYSNIGS